jgi:hypothetical protein
MKSSMYPHKKNARCNVWGCGWPFFKRHVNVLDRMPNSASWQMFVEEPLDLVVEVKRSPILLQNEVGVFL